VYECGMRFEVENAKERKEKQIKKGKGRGDFSWESRNPLSRSSYPLNCGSMQAGNQTTGQLGKLSMDEALWLHLSML
jgi:hypothetical protein